MKKILLIFLAILLAGCAAAPEPTEPETEPTTIPMTEPPTQPPTEPPTEPTEPDGPDLPQTGQMNWPVPVLAMMGMLLVMAGFWFCMTGRRERDEA